MRTPLFGEQAWCGVCASIWTLWLTGTAMERFASDTRTGAPLPPVSAGGGRTPLMITRLAGGAPGADQHWMSENGRGGRQFVGQALLEGVRADLRCGCHAHALDQGQDGPDDPCEDRGTIWIIRTEMRLHANHPRRLQARGLQHRPQARPERGINAGRG